MMFITKKINLKVTAAALAAVLSMSLLSAPAYADTYQVGDVVTFGTYEQDNNRTNGAEDIQWIVLDKQDNRVMLISQDCLDVLPYNSALEATNWEYCSLRAWLNEDFYNEAFTEAEQSRIYEATNENPAHEIAKTSSGRTTVDRVSILSRKEAETLFGSITERSAAPTEYAKAKGVYVNPDTHTGWWWLRTTSFLHDHVTYVTSLGGVSEQGRAVNRTDAGIRPVIWMTVE